MEHDIVYADPSWKYSFSKSTSRSIENHYPTMDLAAIKTLGSKLPMKHDSLLLLWATAPKLPQALEVMAAWGFEYKSCAVWDKVLMGMGYWWRGQHELLLVGTRGRFKPPKPSGRAASVIKERRGRHSAKPLVVYEWIEKNWPPEQWSLLELFARQKRPSWSAWGNEVDCDVSL
jgi:N6-adenosine-specific RNA methylase IME4